jgi:hypothetical protein
VAYQAASWSDLSIGYRHLALRGGSETGVQNLDLGCVVLPATSASKSDDTIKNNVS